METKQFNSSQIKEGKYDKENKVLTITFNTGKEYEYHQVPLEKWQGLCEAESAGKYFNANIKFQHKYFTHG